MPERTDLGAGLVAFAERRWDDACTLLGGAEAAAPLLLDQLEMLARAAALCGRDDEAFDALARTYHGYLAVEAPTDADELRAARAAFWLGYRLGSLHERGRSHAWLARSAELANRHPGAVEHGYLLLPGIHHLLHLGDAAGSAATAAEAVAIGFRHSDAELQALGTQLRGRALLADGLLDAAVDAFGEAMLLAADDSVTELPRGLVYCSVLDGCQQAFAVERAREWAEVLSDWALAQPQLLLFTGRCRVHRAELLCLGGAWQAALAEAETVIANPRAEAHELGAANYQRGEIYRLRGEFALAEVAYRDANDCGHDPHPGLALLRLAEGRADDAAAGIGRVLATTEQSLSRAQVLPAAIEIALTRGAIADAAALSAELDRIAQAHPSTLLETLAVQASGLLALADGRPADALPQLRRAQSAWVDLDSPYYVARVRTLLGECLSALGDGEGARWEQTAAEAALVRLGAAPDLARLRAGRPAADSRQYAITPRELQVLRLAASGLTNKAIATELQVSTRTVDRHMSELMRRIGVSSRVAATAYAYEHGLLGG
ncbi:helix-turn-helix transcriptional regulator [Microterricola viridarii]|uniref:HTH luxR-type domain-containing protein n=1 Tax=Microterricola viridarii TaxID=412690 RepID=A0A109QWQ7_9MICO|nr:LuxR C-terminal-related transcriptional regulator [Microterricola viridarii]AMB58549.1 hypothetical protein AWU67_06400 [Microterricola viridarii]